MTRCGTPTTILAPNLGMRGGDTRDRNGAEDFRKESVHFDVTDGRVAVGRLQLNGPHDAVGFRNQGITAIVDLGL